MSRPLLLGLGLFAVVGPTAAAQPCQPVCNVTNASLDGDGGAAPPFDGGDPGAGAWAASMAVLAAALLLHRASPGRQSPAAPVRGLDA